MLLFIAAVSALTFSGSSLIYPAVVSTAILPVMVLKKKLSYAIPYALCMLPGFLYALVYFSANAWMDRISGIIRNWEDTIDRRRKWRSNDRRTGIAVLCRSVWRITGVAVLLPVFFLAGILWDIFYRRRKESRVFLYYLVFLALTVYNPVLVKYVIPKVHFESEYYRFIWILPVIPGAAYYAVRIVEAVRFRWLKAVTALILAAVIVTTGTPVPGIAKDYVMAENIYKVPNELRSVCDVIHQDCDKEQPKVVFDNELNLVARQYDPSLILVLDRNFILYRAGSTVVGNYENSKAYQIQKVIMDVISYQMDVGIDKFRQVLKRTETDYLVLPVDLTNHDYIRQAGCTPIAQTEKYVVYRFEG